MRGRILSTTSLGRFFHLLTHLSNKLYICKKKPDDLRLTKLVPDKVNRKSPVSMVTSETKTELILLLILQNVHS